MKKILKKETKIIHRLVGVSQTNVSMINNVKTRPAKSRVVEKFQKQMGADHKVLVV